MYRLITGLPKGKPLSAAVAVAMFAATAAVVSVRARFDRRAGMHADGQVVVVVVVGATVVFVGTSMSACGTSSVVVVAVGCVVIGLVVSKGAVVVS